MIQQLSHQSGAADTTPVGSPQMLAVPVPQAARMLGISRSKFYRQMQRGAIRAVKAGKRTLVPIASLNAYLASLPEALFRS